MLMICLIIGGIVAAFAAVIETSWMQYDAFTYTVGDTGVDSG